MSGPEIEGFDWLPTDEEMLEVCPQCGEALDWVDPASIAYEYRDEYLKARKLYGAAEVLNSEAGLCVKCGYELSQVLFWLSRWEDLGYA